MKKYTNAEKKIVKSFRLQAVSVYQGATGDNALCCRKVTSTMVTSSEQALTDTTDVTSPWTTPNISQSAKSVAGDCLILGVNVTIPWDNPRNLISMEDEYLIDRLKAAIFIPILYLVGAPANVVNMVVFFRQGLKERIYFCLFSLALVDLVYLTLVFVIFAERVYTQFTREGGERFGPVYQYVVNNNVIGLYGFSYGSALLSAVISTERCVCVLFPLRAQGCIPTKVLAIVVVISVSVLGFLRFAITAQYRVPCFYEEGTGRTSWRVYVTDYHFRYKTMLSVLDGALYGFCVSVGCPFVVLITTTLTAVKLRRVVRWAEV